MASESSEKMAWGLLGAVLGAGGMYVLGKEKVWQPNPVEGEDPILMHTYKFSGEVQGARRSHDGKYEFEDGTHLLVKRDPKYRIHRITGTAQGRTLEEALNNALESIGELGSGEITVTSSKVTRTDKLY